MRLRYWGLMTLLSLLILAGRSSIHAQSDQPALPQPSGCSDLVTQALEETDRACSRLERNSACYGFFRVDATFFEAQPPDFFTKPADRGALDLFQSIHTAPLNLDHSQWGTAVLNVMANVPNSTPGKAVSLILMGDADLGNAVPPDQAFVPSEPVALQNLTVTNLRSTASPTANVIASIPSNTPLAADAISPDNQWLRVSYEGQIAWLDRGAVGTDAELAKQLDALAVFEAGSRTPMQAFYVRTGAGGDVCEEAPSLLVVQGPENFTVYLNANGADIAVSSTVAFRTLTPDAPAVLSGHSGAVTTTAFSPDNRHVVSADEQGTIRLWTVPPSDGSGNPPQGTAALLSRDSTSLVTKLLFSADGTQLAALDADGMVWLWNMASPTTPAVVLNTPGAVSMAIAADGSKLATAYGNGSIQVWDLSTGLGSIALLTGLAETGTPVLALTFSQEGSSLAAAGENGIVWLGDLVTGDRSTTGSELANSAAAAAFSADGQFVAYALPDGTMELRDVSTGAQLALIPGPGTPVTGLAFSPDRLMLAAGIGTTVQLWELDSEVPVNPTLGAVLEGHLGPISDVSFSGNSKRLASSSQDGTVRVWELAPDQLQLFAVHGEASVNGVPVPAGFTTTVSLTSDPTTGWEQTNGQWSPPRPWTPDEQQSLGPLAGIPGGLLNYPIEMPGGTEVAGGPSAPECHEREDWTGIHNVQSGETLTGIAALYGITVEELQIGNCIVNPDLIVAGQSLRVPAGSITPPTSGCRIIAVGGGSQDILVGLAFPAPLQVQVVDGSGSPMPGVDLTFNSPGLGPGGSFPGGAMSVVLVTDANGMATAPAFTASTISGTYTVWAARDGCESANFTLTNLVGAPDSIVAVAGSGQSANSGTTFPMNLQALVRDIHGNGVAGVTVTFVTPSGSFAGNPTVVTDSNGIATAPPLTAGGCGTYTATASAPGISVPAVFILTTGNSLVVTNTNDSGTGSLRQVIADACPGGTITFGVNGTITLTSGLLMVDKSLIIMGPGAGSLTVNGSKADGVFYVAGGSTAVSISGMTVANGNAEVGGGVYNEGILTLTNVAFTGNEAYTGAGIFNMGALTLVGCSFSNNTILSAGSSIVAHPWDQLTSAVTQFLNTTIGSGNTNPYCEGYGLFIDLGGNTVPPTPPDVSCGFGVY